MLFGCPPTELTTHILSVLSFSGQDGVVLDKLWNIAAQKLGLGPLDEFQKGIIWQWLFCSEVNRSKVLLKASLLSGLEIILPPLTYQLLIEAPSTETVFTVLPSEDTQWHLLTGNENFKLIKQSLGEFPFQLLCVIAKYGTVGIQAPELCRETNQDPRSLTPRLKKLEEFGLIKRSNIYNEEAKIHTSLSVHFKFASNDARAANSDFKDDFQLLRNIGKLKQHVMLVLKAAPNQLRGLQDLKHDLKLDKDKSSSKFFTSILDSLEKRGHVERVIVQQTARKLKKSPKQVYCIKFVKEIPKDADEISDYVDIISSIDDINVNDEDIVPDQIPTLNRVFPITNQIYSSIVAFAAEGTTSMATNRSMTGLSDYRPYNRLCEPFTTFNSDGKKLKALRNYTDPYPDWSVVRSYDYEGKFKFYRYFSIQNCGIEKPPQRPTQGKNVRAVSSSLLELNKKLYLSTGKAISGSLLHAFKRKNELELENRSKKSKSVDTLTKRGRGRPRKDAKVIENPLENETVVAQEEPPQPTEEVLSGPLRAQDLPAFKAAPKANSTKTESKRKKENSLTAPKLAAVSLKALRRQEALLELIQEDGGVTFTTIALCRKIDAKLGSENSVTDAKTLARDVLSLIKNDSIDVETIVIERNQVPVTRKLLIVKGDGRPSDDKIQEMKDKCGEYQRPKYHLPERRTIKTQVTLYNDLPRRRLKSLNSKNKQKEDTSFQPEVGVGYFDAIPIPETKVLRKSKKVLTDVANTTTDSNPLTTLTRRSRKKRQKQTSSNPSFRAVNRYRSNAKFDLADATTLFRAVVIRKTFNRGIISFPEIASLFENMSAKEVRQKWVVVRKVIGGLDAVLKGMSAFEHIVLKAIEEDLVSEEELESGNLGFYLDLWKDADNSVLLNIDNTPLFENYEDNRKEYQFYAANDGDFDLFEQLEDNSMKQKEHILSSTVFSYANNIAPIAQENDEIRCVVKAVIATNQDNFLGSKAKDILGKYDEKSVHDVLNALIKDREISFFSLEDHERRFQLSDKFNSTLMTKIFSHDFFTLAASFREVFASLSEGKRGLILSQGIQNGEMASFLQLFSQLSLLIVRLEKPYTFQGYESRLIDKDILSCDILATVDPDVGKNTVVKVSVPLGQACSRIWLDMNGNISTQMWTRIVSTVLHYVVFRPGIPGWIIHSKMQVVLSVADFSAVMDWLVESRCISRGPYDGYWACDSWYEILGN